MSSYNSRLEDLIDHHQISNEELTKKKQMGGVGYLLNGNMCFGIFEDNLVVRMDREVGRSLTDQPGIREFESTRGENEYFISIVPEIYENPKALDKFLTHALEFTSGLPPKEDDRDLGLDDAGLDNAGLDDIGL